MPVPRTQGRNALDELEFNANRKLERKITERSRSQELYETILYAAPCPIVIVARDGKVVVVNRQVERVFG
ncbi:MAG: PAS domain-containing protein [Alphaproteobacteria bacterium]|nr:PAS domain-containing protein [Alphaproteobacteria bacterium]